VLLVLLFSERDDCTGVLARSKARFVAGAVLGVLPGKSFNAEFSFFSEVFFLPISFYNPPSEFEENSPEMFFPRLLLSSSSPK